MKGHSTNQVAVSFFYKQPVYKKLALEWLRAQPPFIKQQ